MVGNKKSSSGGKAEATGSNYETLVAAWYCVRALSGRAAQPPFGLSASAQLTDVHCQTGDPVDDVNASTSDGGVIFVQAKRSTRLSDREDSALGGAIDQFVRQYKQMEDGSSVRAPGRAFDPVRDRMVLVTPSRSSKKILEILPETPPRFARPWLRAGAFRYPNFGG